jgi:hypothetical protein
MLVLGFAVLSFTVALGSCLIGGKFYRHAVVHGLSGALGLGAICLAFGHGPLTGKFAGDVVVLLGAALAGGLTMVVLARRGMARPALLVALHGMAGGLGYLLMFGFVFGH